ncbi:MAG TPA: glycosyltransferase family 2 protein [Anaerolineae bacterium]
MLDAHNAWPRVTVVVLNWNGRGYLSDCFDSLHALDYPRDRLELLMVDNGSTDDSVAFVRAQYPQVKIVETGKNLGFAGGNNAGARAASGEYVAFLNNDAHVYPDWLPELVRAVQSDPDVACVGSRMMDLTGTRVEFGGSSINFYGYGYQEGYDRTNSAAHRGTHPAIFACGGAFLVRRDVFLESGGLDEDYFIYYEDVDLGWRLWVMGYKVLYVGSAVVLHKHHGAKHQMPDASRRVLYERNAMLTLIKNYDDANLARVWPAALLLAVKRLYLMAGLDSRTYRIGYSAPKVTSPPRPVKGARWLRVLREEGLLEVGRRAMSLVRRKLGLADPPYPPPNRRTLPGLEPGYEQVSRMALAHLVAANDVVDLLPRALEKRAKVQAARRRSDAEIFHLFGRPFDPSFFDPDYEATQAQLTRLFDLPRLFEGKDSAP